MLTPVFIALQCIWGIVAATLHWLPLEGQCSVLEHMVRAADWHCPAALMKTLTLIVTRKHLELGCVLTALFTLHHASHLRELLLIPPVGPHRLNSA